MQLSSQWDVPAARCSHFLSHMSLPYIIMTVSGLRGSREAQGRKEGGQKEAKGDQQDR